jgi:hypothetical protein
MHTEIAKYNTSQGQPTELDGNYESTSIKTTSHWYKYILYLFITIFVAGCLIFIFLAPKPVEGQENASKYIDYFILALAGIITIYYLRDYYNKKI